MYVCACVSFDDGRYVIHIVHIVYIYLVCCGGSLPACLIASALLLYIFTKVYTSLYSVQAEEQITEKELLIATNISQTVNVEKYLIATAV